MSWNGSGTYILPPAFSPEVNGTTIDATRYNGLTTDVAGGISACLAKNGENVPTANLPMAGFKFTGLGEGTAIGQALTYNQTAAALLGGALGVTGLITATAGVAGALNGSIGATTPSTGAFTTLSASGAVSGVGFSNYLAAPPAIGGTTPAAGTFTSLTYSTMSLPIDTATGASAIPTSANGRGIRQTDAATRTVNTATAGQVVTVFNDNGAAMTLTQGAGVTLRIPGGGLTGSRQISGRGLCQLVWITSSEVWASGAGVF